LDYEDLKPYVEKVVRREYPLKGKPLYFAKTSGTTSGQNTFRFLKNRCRTILKLEMQFIYIHETGKADFVDGKMIFCKEVLFWKKTESSLVDYQDCSTFYSQISTEK
jgi:hypothetical protein